MLYTMFFRAVVVLDKLELVAEMSNIVRQDDTDASSQTGIDQRTTDAVMQCATNDTIKKAESPCDPF